MPVPIAVLLDHEPALTETFVVNEIAALRAIGHDVTVRVRDAQRSSWRDLAWLVARSPRGCLWDLWARRRWRREEWVPPLRRLAREARAVEAAGARHLHAHFAMGAALDALRVGRLLRLPYSVTAHAFDIWLMPRNLAEKLCGAAFVSTGSEYNARALRALGARVEVIVMGVDGSVWRRSRPLGGGRVVLAVGRLVRKKGFDVLARAAALLDDVRVVVVGEGPLASSLEGVELAGALGSAGVRALMEEADVLAMPCVIAPDGDRDSMPVVVKEAMAMELCVVASDEVGLPECVMAPWGVLVAPGDPAALAAALRETLALAPSARAAAGATARAWALAHADLHTETAKLSALVDASACGELMHSAPHA